MKTKSSNKETIVIGIILLVFTSYFYIVVTKDYSVVPEKIQTQLNFKPVVAGAQKTISQPNDFTVGLNGSLLTYEQEYENRVLNVSQRTIPDEIKDFPERYDQFIKTIAPQSQVEVNGTTFYLSSDGLKQTVIAKQGNLLIFVSTEGALTDTQWSDFLSKLKSN